VLGGHSWALSSRSRVLDKRVLIVHSIVRRPQKWKKINDFNGIGGRGGIRTHGTLAGTPVFKTGALNHSATLPNQYNQ
jgi:hypothetical protein